MIEIKGLRKIYKIKVKESFFKSSTKKINAVDGINMIIEPGKIVGLLGINGAGKTTTIKMLSTLLHPDGGSATVDGMDIIKDDIKIKKIVNMMAGGEKMIYGRLTAKENLKYFGSLYNIPKGEVDKSIKQLMEFVGLKERMDEPVERFSKGMKQRLQIARGLINNPKYLFMDEPTIGLDAPIAKDLREYTKSLAVEQKKGILLTSHYMKEVEELCDYIYVIDKGANLLEGTPKDITSLITKQKYKYCIKVCDTKCDLQNEVDKFNEYTNGDYKVKKNDDSEYKIDIMSKKDIQSELLNVLARNSKILEFSLQEPNLEDAIIQLAEERK